MSFCSIILFCDNVTMEFHGQEQPEFQGTKKGRIYLTTHRMIFNSKSTNDNMQSFSFPFITLSDVELEQPMFGANYIKGKCRAQPNGNWVGESKFKLHFKSGGAIEFGQAMLRAASIGKFLISLLHNLHCLLPFSVKLILFSSLQLSAMVLHSMHLRLISHQSPIGMLHPRQLIKLHQQAIMDGCHRQMFSQRLPHVRLFLSN